MAATATTTVDFGATPVDGKTFTITDAGVSAVSYVEAYIQSNDTTANNTADDHRVAAASMRLSCEPGAGQFNLEAHMIFGLVTGLIKIRYVYSP
jgi:hypothetical protein